MDKQRIEFITRERIRVHDYTVHPPDRDSTFGQVRIRTVPEWTEHRYAQFIWKEAQRLGLVKTAVVSQYVGIKRHIVNKQSIRHVIQDAYTAFYNEYAQPPRHLFCGREFHDDLLCAIEIDMPLVTVDFDGHTGKAKHVLRTFGLTVHFVPYIEGWFLYNGELERR